MKPLPEERKETAKINKRFKAIYYRLREETCNPKNKKYAKNKKLEINSDAWKYFDDFYNDMYESYLKFVEIHGWENVSIALVDPKESYCKQNCYWR